MLKYMHQPAMDEAQSMDEFLNILENKYITTLFQPIISLRDGSVFGYEALSRGPKDSIFHRPDALISYAKRQHFSFELEYLFRYSALRAATQIPQSAKLFLNVDPNIIQDERFESGFTKNQLQHFFIDAERIVFEITERESVHHPSDFKAILNHYRQQNYQVSIDDAGAGYSGLNLISDIRPHYIKLDMHLIRDIDKELFKQALVKGMCEFASLTNTVIIAEGIETKEELAKLIEFDVAYGQGFFIQRPAEEIVPIGEALLAFVRERNKIKNRFFGTRVGDYYIKNIAHTSHVISPGMATSQLCSLLEKDASLPGICVVDKGVPVGTITRRHLYQQLSGLFGHSLFFERPVHNIMDKNFLSVDSKTTIDVAVKRAMLRSPETMYEFIVVTEGNQYFGITTVKDLIDKVLEIEVANAKHLNPLSELPGNIIIEVQLERLINLELDAYVFYFDIDNFKAFNDCYGFENGDKVLKSLTRILKKIVPHDAFLGHIGGDDFILILDRKRAEPLCRAILESFDETIPSFYSSDDISRGYIVARNRKQLEDAFPLMTLSIVGITASGSKNIYELAEKASKMKKLCKCRPGSNLIFEDDFACA